MIITNEFFKKFFTEKMEFTRDKEKGKGTYGVVYTGELKYRDGRKERGASKQVKRKNNISGLGILREIQILQTLSKCTCFPRLLGVFFQDYRRKSLSEKIEKNESVVFVTELMEYNGCDVFGYHDYNINTIIDLCSQLISGVAYMHSKIISHRDIKPTNILLSFDPKTRKPTLKICDFGISQYLANSVPSTPETNTPWYRAPEICWTILKYGAASDVWAVGATIFEILTGTIFSCSSSILQEDLFNQILLKNPNQWTEEIHSVYLKSSRAVLKVNNSLEPCNLPPGEQLLDRFRQSRYFRESDLHIWIKFENLLKRCFEYNYNRRISCWEMIHDSLFDPFRDQINIIVNEIRKPHANEIIEIDIPEDINEKKVTYFTNFINKVPKYPLRPLFHSIDLVNRIVTRPEFEKDIVNLDKIFAFSIYFFHKFFSSLSQPEKMTHFFNGIEDTSTEDNYYILDEWIFNFELKITQVLFPSFKFYRPGIFEMPDEYNQVLDSNKMKILFLEFIKIKESKNKTYRGIYRDLYKKYINPDYIFQ